MKADASTTRTPRLRKSSTPPDSRPSSAGAWIRLTAYGPLGSAAWILSSPADTMCRGNPPAPNEPSMPFCPAAITRSADAMPLAIAPVYSGYLTPYCSMNAAEPEPSIDHGTARTRPAQLVDEEEAVGDDGDAA